MGVERTKSAAGAARRWLEAMAEKKLVPMEAVWSDGFFDALCHSGLRINLIQGGHGLCTFASLPISLVFTIVALVIRRSHRKWQDEDGNWQPGAIATLIDNVGAAAIMTSEGIIKVSVQFDIAYFFPAKLNEEVEIDARMMANKGSRLTAVVVEIRKKGGGQLVAVGRQWMSTRSPIGVESFRGTASSSTASSSSKL